MNSIIIKKLQEDIEFLKNQIKLNINIMLESSKNIKVFQEFENNAKEIFEHQRKTEHFYLSKQSFDNLRGVFFITGGQNYKELKDLIYFYIQTYKFKKDQRRFVNYEDLENRILECTTLEINRIIKLRDNLQETVKLQALIERVEQDIKSEKIIDLERQDLYKFYNFVKDIDVKIILEILEYNNSFINKDVKEAVQEVEEEIKQSDEIKIELQEEEELEEKDEEEKPLEKEDFEEIENLYEEDSKLSLSQNASSIYSVITSMMLTENMEDIQNYIKTTTNWGKAYIDEIINYLKKINDMETLNVIENALDKKEEDTVEENLDKQQKTALLIFKGYDKTTSLIEKDVKQIVDKGHLLGVQKYLDELSCGNINMREEKYEAELAGSYHKKSEKAVRLSYDIIKEGVYYIYNITVKKDNWDKSSRESIKRRRPNDKEKTDLLKALEDKEKFSEIVKRNDEILNNITKYIEDNTNKKNKDLK